MVTQATAFFIQSGLVLIQSCVPRTRPCAKWPVVIRKISVRLRCDSGTLAKYFARATTPSAPFSSHALQPSVCVLMMIASSVLPGSTAQILSVGESGCTIACIVRLMEAWEAAMFFSFLPVFWPTQSAGTGLGGAVNGAAWSSALASDTLFQM